MGPIIIPNEAASPDSVILTLFRHFATRDILLVAVIRTGIRRYAEQIPAPPADDDLCGWLADLLVVTHRLNARNGQVFWDLVGVPDRVAYFSRASAHSVDICSE